MTRIHSDGEIRVSEITERGDLLLTLPFGDFVLPSKRARRGDLTDQITTAFGGQVTGLGVAGDDTDSPPVILNARIYEENGKWFAQPSWIKYADGTDSGFLGCYPRLITPTEPGQSG